MDFFRLYRSHKLTKHSYKVWNIIPLRESFI
jgi:hypothetical protein